MARIEFVIFDFDGTLVDTAEDLILATNLFLTSKGRATLPADVIRADIGMGLGRLFVDAFRDEVMPPGRQEELYAEFIALYEANLLRSPRRFPGALEFLTEWDRAKAIVSNRGVRHLTPILEHVGLAGVGWSSVIGGDTFEVKKPHPHPFLAAMESAGVTPDETLIVGDGEPDVDGAVAVGSRMVAVDFGYAPADDLILRGADYRIAHFDELLPLIRGLT